MNNKSCPVVKDLIPLYVDEVCSEESRTLIESHVAVCQSCMAELEGMAGPLSLPLEKAEIHKKESEGLQAVAAVWKRTKSKAFGKGVLLSTLCAGMLLLGYTGLFRWNVMPVSSNIVSISDVSQLEDGSIAFHLRLTDGYDLNEVRYSMGEDGRFYMTPYRPVVKSKPLTKEGLFNTYYDLGRIQTEAYQAKYGQDAKITSLYLGTKDDPILIWEEGMELPEATEQVKAIFNYE